MNDLQSPIPNPQSPLLMTLARDQNDGHSPTPDRLKRWSWWVVGAGFVLVLYATLFPFDFFIRSGQSAWATLQGFDLALTQAYALADFPRNVVLFVPLGFGLGGLLAASGRAQGWSVLLALAVGLGLSALLEGAQAVALLRFPALADVLANGLGAGLGCGLFALGGDWFWGGVARLAERIRPFLTPRRLLLVYLLYLAAWLAVSAWLPTVTQLRNWDNRFPLIVGNEQTRDRPWQGTLRQFYLADKALSEAEVARLLAGESATAVAGASLVAYHDFTRAGSTGFPLLVAQGAAVSPRTADGVALSAASWLESDGAVTAVSDALAASSRLTVGLAAASGDLAQGGPARLVSISGDPFNRNLTLGQAGPDLVVRLRTPLTGANGRQPEFIIPNVFTDEQMHRIVITYDGTAVRLAIDSPDNVYAIELLPAVALFIYTFPNDIGQMRLNQTNVLIFRLLYALLLFWPWAAWLARQRPFVVWLTIGLVLPPLVWEWLLSQLLPEYALRAGYVALGVGGTAVLLLFFSLLTRRRRNIDLQVG